MRDHPLFPPMKDDEESPDVHQIRVNRFEGGKPLWCPKPFMPEELEDEARLYELFGGGHYELVARDARKIVRRVQLHLSGPSKPLHGVMSEPEPEPKQATPPPAEPRRAREDDGGGMLGAVIALIGTMMQSQSQMLTAMLASGRDASREHVSQMQAAYKAQSETMAQLMTALATRGGGSSSEEAFEKMGARFMEAIDLGVTLATQKQAAAAQEGGAESDLEAVTSGMKAAADLVGTLTGTPKKPSGDAPAAEPS